MIPQRIVLAAPRRLRLGGPREGDMIVMPRVTIDAATGELLLAGKRGGTEAIVLALPAKDIALTVGVGDYLVLGGTGPDGHPVLACAPLSRELVGALGRGLALLPVLARFL